MLRLEEPLLLVFFGYSITREIGVFDCEELSNKKLDNVFLNNFYMWDGVSIGGCHTHVVNFLDWFSSGRGRGHFLAFTFFFLLAAYCLQPVYLYTKYNFLLILKKKKTCLTSGVILNRANKKHDS